MGGLLWTETLRGWLSCSATDFNEATLHDHRESVRASFDLAIDDVQRCIGSDLPQVSVTAGYLDCEGLGGRLDVLGGEFQLFVPASDALPDQLHMRMRYKLALRGPFGEPMTLLGFKLLENDPGYDSWVDSTTLFTRVYAGAEVSDNESEPFLAIGVLRVGPLAFLRQLSTFRPNGQRWPNAIASTFRFQAFFTKQLAKTYVGAPLSDTRPSFPRDLLERQERRPGTRPAWKDVEGNSRLQRAIVPFSVEDLDFPLNLHRLRLRGRSDKRGERGPILLVPGSGMRAQLFYGQPVGTSFAEYLLHEGYDVWVESWRASIDHPRNSYTLDQAAALDHPAAVDRVLELAAPHGDQLKTVVHCMGSISFLMAAVSGSFGEKVSHIVSNAVSLCIDVTDKTWLKQRLTLPGVKRMMVGADAQWGIRPETPQAAMLAAFAKRVQRPCGSPACQVANFMYGSGWDVLLRHVDDQGRPWVADEVHAWGSRELGYTPITLIDQIAESSRYGHIVPSASSGATPGAYVARPAATRAKLTFVAGDHNKMFRWQGQERTAALLRRSGCAADFVPLHGYGHLDTFWGRRSATDVFPTILRALEWTGLASDRPSNGSAPHAGQPERDVGAGDALIPRSRNGKRGGLSGRLASLTRVRAAR